MKKHILKAGKLLKGKTSIPLQSIWIAFGAGLNLQQSLQACLLWAFINSLPSLRNLFWSMMEIPSLYLAPLNTLQTNGLWKIHLQYFWEEEETFLTTFLKQRLISIECQSSSYSLLAVLLYVVRQSLTITMSKSQGSESRPISKIGLSRSFRISKFTNLIRIKSMNSTSAQLATIKRAISY